MDQTILSELEHGQRIDITTIGRHSGEPRRIEIVFHNFGGHIFISGMPRADRRRSWLANLEANPRFTFHLKGGLHADLAATATEVTDEARRREILTRVAKVWRRQDVEEMVRDSPLVEVSFDAAETA